MLAKRMNAMGKVILKTSLLRKSSNMVFTVSLRVCCALPLRADTSHISSAFGLHARKRGNYGGAFSETGGHIDGAAVSLDHLT